MKSFFPQQSVPLAGGRAYCTILSRCLGAKLFPLAAVAMLTNMARVNVQQIPLFTCSRRLLADMSSHPGNLRKCIYVWIKAAGCRFGLTIVEFQPSSPTSLLSLVTTQWRATLCLTESSTWLGGPFLLLPSLVLRRWASRSLAHYRHPLAWKKNCTTQTAKPSQKKYSFLCCFVFKSLTSPTCTAL